MIKGNKGEWSEIYALLKLLGDGKIYAADENVNKIEDLYFPILKILRAEDSSAKYEYLIEDVFKKVKIILNGVIVAEYDAGDFVAEAKKLYETIVAAGGKSTFGAESTESFIRKIGCSKLKAPPVDSETKMLGKSDITMQIHDPRTGHKPISGFSIKSDIGNAPTLLNAGKTTNFIYEVKGLTRLDILKINSINTRTKIIDRVKAIKARSTGVKFKDVASEVFDANLEVVDSKMAEILAYALFYYYNNEISTCAQAVEKLMEENPIKVRNPKGYYATKFKNFLTSIALGMVPSKPWYGNDEAQGGYILVTGAGDVLAYYIYNRNNFQEYLLNNTKFERASTSRHDFALLYEKNGKTYINLNMQIRFVK